MDQNKFPDIIILGSTGSVGSQAIDVAAAHNIKINALSADRNSAKVEEQARRFGVSACAMNNEDAAKDLKTRLADTDIKVYSGSDGICEMITGTKSENAFGQTVINSIVGEAGLKPTLATLSSGKKLALANKESLVVGGETVMSLAKERKIDILPVDSEHSAIFQCLQAGNKNEIKKLILTASGGPFFGYTSDELDGITVEKALAHPTWSMGAKITVDSATLMNKGFEVIEAVHLFGVSPEKIEVVVHRESIIHSAVEYIDNSIIAQMSLPDMKHCIQYALTYPCRATAATEELNLFKLGRLSFAKPDTDTFILLKVALDAIKAGGGVPATLNAANEEAVAAFLAKKISFRAIFDIVADTVASFSHASEIHDIDGIFDISAEARRVARDKILQKN